jgi:lipopolysaccharide transport system permease protein
MVFLFVFGKSNQAQIGSTPYLVFAVTGLAAWSYFAFVVNQSGAAIITSQEMIKKIYFPRLVIPLSKALVGIIDFLVVLLLVVGVMLYYGYVPGAKIVWLPCWLALVLVAALAGGIGLSALSIRYRDFQHVTGFLVQLGLFLTPVAYPSTNIPADYQLLYFINPMAGITEGFRWSLLQHYALPHYWWVSVVSTLVGFVVAIYFFKKIEYKIADIL